MNSSLRSLICILTAGVLVSARQEAKADYVVSAKHFILELSQGHYESASKQFDQRMAEALPPEKLENVWKSLLAQTGSFKEMVKTRTEELQGNHVVYVTCAFEKTNLDAKIAFNDNGQIAGLFFVPSQSASAVPGWTAPEYVHRHRFYERTVTIGTVPWQVPGVLTIPKEAARCAGVVLVHGSGPSDEDGTIGPNKPLRDLAWGLASQGIAVLRYRKRTLVYSAELPKRMAGFTVREESMDDARAAVTLLGHAPEVDQRRVYLLGYSFGGMLAPRIAATDSEIAGIILVAAPSRPIEQSIVEQIRYLAELPGVNSKDSAQSIADAEHTAEQIEDPNLAPGSIVDFMGSPIPGSYWLDLRSYRPAACAAGLTIPILVLHGGRDYQVTQADFAGWKTALAARSNATFRLYPDLNHLLVAGSGMSIPAEYEQPGHVSQQVIDDVARWITAETPAS